MIFTKNLIIKENDSIVFTGKKSNKIISNLTNWQGQTHVKLGLIIVNLQ